MCVALGIRNDIFVCRNYMALSLCPIVRLCASSPSFSLRQHIPHRFEASPKAITHNHKLVLSAYKVAAAHHARTHSHILLNWKMRVCYIYAVKEVKCLPGVVVTIPLCPSRTRRRPRTFSVNIDLVKHRIFKWFLHFQSPETADVARTLDATCLK